MQVVRELTAAVRQGRAQAQHVLWAALGGSCQPGCQTSQAQLTLVDCCPADKGVCLSSRAALLQALSCDPRASACRPAGACAEPPEAVARAVAASASERPAARGGPARATLLVLDTLSALLFWDAAQVQAAPGGLARCSLARGSEPWPRHAGHAAAGAAEPRGGPLCRAGGAPCGTRPCPTAAPAERGPRPMRPRPPRCVLTRTDAAGHARRVGGRRGAPAGGGHAGHPPSRRRGQRGPAPGRRHAGRQPEAALGCRPPPPPGSQRRAPLARDCSPPAQTLLRRAATGRVRVETELYSVLPDGRLTRSPAAAMGRGTATARPPGAPAASTALTACPHAAQALCACGRRRARRRLRAAPGRAAAAGHAADAHRGGARRCWACR